MIYRSPRPSIDIPEASLADFVLARAQARGNRPALVDSVTGRTIAFAQLPDLVDRTAAGLARLGVRRGNVCALLSANVLEYPIATLSIARLGAIATTASPLYTKADLRRPPDRFAGSTADHVLRARSHLDGYRSRRRHRARDHIRCSDRSGDRLQRSPGTRSASPGSRSREQTSSRCRIRAGRPACPRA